MLKGIKGLTGLVFVAYFVSMIAGPTWGQEGSGSSFERVSSLEGVANGVSYKIVMSPPEGGQTEALAKDSEYTIKVVCTNQAELSKELNVALPPGFKLYKHQVLEKSLFTNEDVAHYFEIRSPSQTGVYKLEFNGRDNASRNFNFAAYIPVVDSPDDYNAAAAVKRSILSRTVSLPEGQAIVFPKAFKSEKGKPFMFTLIGGCAGAGLALGALQNNMAALVFPVSTALVAAGAVIGGYLGFMVDDENYSNSDTGWLCFDRTVEPQSIMKEGGILYLLGSSPIYAENTKGRIVGTLNKAEFRRILGTANEGNYVWYKIKKADVAIF
jgi:hypothetical protein